MQYLRVRVGRAVYLAPSTAVGTILHRPVAPATSGRKPIDARRMAARAPGEDDAPTMIGWRSRRGGPLRQIIVDEVFDLVTLDAAEVAPLPASVAAATPLFDGLWYDIAHQSFLLRVRLTKADTLAERRRIAAVLAPLIVPLACTGASTPTPARSVP